MKTKIVLAGLLAILVVVKTAAQRAEFDDMYFRAKDREISKAVEAQEAYASAKTKKQKAPDVLQEEEDYTNPTDSYSARNINPEYVSRSNAEQAGEDESNYFLEGYTPPTYSDNNFNNSYYNNANWARSSYYGNAMWNSPYYGYGMAGYGMGGMRYYDPWMNPYYGGFYDPWMMPSYGYGFGPSYGWRSGWSVSLTYGSFWNPYGGWYGGYGNPYYGGYGYPGYYYGGGYYESPRVVNYGKRPSRHSAVVQPTQRTRTQPSNNVANTNSGRTRQAQDDYYVRPVRRASSTSSTFDNSTQRSSSGTRSTWSTPSSTPTRSRDSYSSPTRTPSYTPSSSPSPSRGSSSGSSSSGGSRSSSGSSSPRPRGN